MSAPQPRPIAILIAALGGEGGGVLTDWIVSAAAQLDFPVQSTSIPGVAQRTGATTYYIEIVPVPAHEIGARPVLALAPGIGDVDIVLASELMEAGRTIAGGFVTPDRTLVIASTARSYLVVEKMAMGDGRYDSARLIKAVKTHAQSHLLLDMDALAKQSSAMINAVMLGLIAGCGRVPIPAAVFENAIRADGKAVDANLRGFRSGLDAATNAKCSACHERHRQRGSRGRGRGCACRARTRDRHAGGGPRRRARWRAAARRLSRPRLCATLCRPAGADPRRRRARRSRWAPDQGNRASPRRAHVVRGRDPGSASQDRSRAPQAHCRGDGS
jgi:Pyruvate/2-oxoacid:ferredoxin oxidoreductase gamma subunit